MDFSISFWLYPATTGDGETVFSWQGMTKVRGEIIQQELRISIRRRKLVFRFDNFFLSPDRREFTLELESSKTLIPRMWAHHTLRFEGDTGLVEYLSDGVTDALAYANPSNRETGTVFFPYTGNTDSSKIYRPRYTGLIDEFVISRDSGKEPENMTKQMVIKPDLRS